MASLAGVLQCSSLLTIADTSRVWLRVHLLLYCTLDLGTLATLGAMEVNSDLHVASKVLTVGVDVFFAVVQWPIPFHGVVLLLAAGVLVLLRSWAGLRWYWFRMAALAVFVVPALPLALLLSTSGMASPLAVLPMHILMGLLVVQPRWPNAIPSMDQHRW